MYTPSCRCEKFEDHSSVCFDYINDNVRVVNQSSYISAALANVIDIVNGSYCRERVMELLCNYFFPRCEHDTEVVPICQSSCNEYLMTGICVDHLLNVLTTLNASNVPVDGLFHNNCYSPYNVTVSDNCTVLAGTYTRRR